MQFSLSNKEIASILVGMKSVAQVCMPASINRISIHLFLFARVLQLLMKKMDYRVLMISL